MKAQKLILWTAVALVGAGLLGYDATPAQARPPAGAAAATAPTNSVAVHTQATDPKPTAAKPPLTGAELYSINCERCHQERYPTERTGAQWKTILLHMQVRANLPVKQAKLILRFLQENSGR